MQQQPINFREERDLGEITNATFGFIRQHFKLIFRSLLFFVLPFALIGGIFLGIYQARQLPAAPGEVRYQSYGDYEVFNQVTSVNYLTGLFFIYLSGFIITLVIYNLIVLFMNEPGEITMNILWERIKGNFLTNLYASIGAVVCIIAGFFLFIIPGIYLAVVFSVFTMVMVREEVGFVEAAERSFYLVKGNWWSTLGMLLLIGFIQLIMNMLASLPSWFLQVMETFQVPGFDNKILVIISSSLTWVIGILFYPISITACAFQYFNLVEIKDGVGLLAEVEKIGTMQLQPVMQEGDF